jgi:hypothetical protein
MVLMDTVPPTAREGLRQSPPAGDRDRLREIGLNSRFVGSFPKIRLIRVSDRHQDKFTRGTIFLKPVDQTKSVIVATRTEVQNDDARPEVRRVTLPENHPAEKKAGFRRRVKDRDAIAEPGGSQRMPKTRLILLRTADIEDWFPWIGFSLDAIPRVLRLIYNRRICNHYTSSILDRAGAIYKVKSGGWTDRAVMLFHCLPQIGGQVILWGANLSVPRQLKEPAGPVQCINQDSAKTFASLLRYCGITGLRRSVSAPIS